MTAETVTFFLARYTHLLAGITWIGFLYYLNMAHVPFMGETEASVKPHVVSKLLPRVLWWFRWGAMFTFLSGLVLLAIDGKALAASWFDAPLGLGITVGALFAIIMFLNVWLVIWPKQQIVMASNAQVMGGGTALPAAAASARRAFLCSRTNFIFSIPMIFFMGAGRWLPVKAPEAGAKIAFLAIALLIMGVFEFSALTGDKGPLTKPLDTPRSAIHTGVAIAVILAIVFVAGFGPA